MYTLPYKTGSWWEAAIKQTALLGTVAIYRAGKKSGREAQGEGDIYNYNWLTLLYGRNKHNNVKQLSSNLKKYKSCKKQINKNKILKVIKNKESLRNCQGKRKPKETC